MCDIVVLTPPSLASGPPRRGDASHQAEESTAAHVGTELTPHPFLAHTLRQEQSSVLSLAACSRHIFSGSQGKDIYVSSGGGIPSIAIDFIVLRSGIERRYTSKLPSKVTMEACWL